MMATLPTDSCTLDDLVGEHVLTGVDFGSVTFTEGWHGGETANTCVFELDDVVYTVTEDPSDGYRSSMESIAKGGTVTNRFPPCRVVGSMKVPDPDSYESSHDVLELRDVTTGLIVLEVGTGNTDDYYPYYVANFDPKAMEVNSGK
jgi:hypothetical protein